MNHRLVTFLGVTLVFIFFGFFVLPKAIQWKVDRYFKEKFDSKFHYEKVEWTQEGLVFSQVNLQSRSKGPVQYALDVDKVTINYFLEPFDRKIDLNVLLFTPHFYVVKKNDELQPHHFFKEKAKNLSSDSLFSIKIGNSPLIRSHLHLKAEEGTFELITLENEKNTLLPFTFTGDFGSSEEVSKKINVTIDSVSAEIEKSKNIELSFSQANVKPLLEGVQFFAGKNWIMPLTGTANGKVTLSEEGSLGDLIFQNFKFEKKTSNAGLLFQQLKVQFSEKKDKTSKNLSWFEKGILNTALNLKIENEAVIKGLEEEWHVSQLKGNLTFDNSLQAIFQGNFNNQNQNNVPFSLNLNLEDHFQNGLITLKLDPFIAKFTLAKRHVDLEFENLGPREYALARTLLPRWAFVWNEANFLKGTLAGHLKGMLSDNNQLTHVNIEKIDGKALWFTTTSLHVDGYIERLKGNIEFVLKTKQNHLIPKNGLLTLTEGDLYWERHTDESESSLERLTHLNCSVKIEEGQLKEGKFTGNLAGMEAELQFFGLKNDTLAQMQLKGSASKFLKHLPYSFARDLERVTSEEDVIWNGTIQTKENGLYLSSQLHVAETGKEALIVDLTANLDRVPKKYWEKLPTKWQRWGVTLLEKEEDVSMPFHRKDSSYIMKLSWLKDDQGVWGITLKQGTLKSDYFPINPYLKPFIFEKDGIAKGSLKFTGDFNDRSLLIHFQVKDLILENKAFQVRLDEVGYAPITESSLSNPASFIYFDFRDETTYGFIPVKKGAYFDKSNQLPFDDVEALISLQKNRIQLSQISCHSLGVNFKGNIDLDLSDDSATKMNIQAEEVEGSVTDVQAFCSHFGKSSLWKIPLTGQLKTERTGIFVEGIIPNSDEPSTFTWSVQGTLEEGAIAFPKHQAQFKEIAVQFYYQSDSRCR